MYPKSKVTIQSAYVHDYTKNGITVNGEGAYADILGNVVEGVGRTGVIAQNGIQIRFGDHRAEHGELQRASYPGCFQGPGILRDSHLPIRGI